MARVKKRDYYDVLGVAKDANDAELKRAFRELARKYHPDINTGDDDAEERFKEANEAYAVLSDEKQRARYDRFGHVGLDGGGEQPSSGFGAVVDAFDDIVGDILRRRRARKRGRDLRYTLELTFEEAAFGCTKKINVPEPGDGGATKRKPREFSVTIAAGTKEGAVKMIKGEGESGKSGGGSGDLHVYVRVKEHPVFSRDGTDVWCDVPISFSQAALGAVVEIPTLDGKVKMRIPEATQSGRVFRIRNKGITRGGGNRGDQKVRVIVETPAGLTPRQRELLEDFADASGESVAHPQKKGFLDKVKALF